MDAISARGRATELDFALADGGFGFAAGAGGAALSKENGTAAGVDTSTAESDVELALAGAASTSCTAWRRAERDSAKLAGAFGAGLAAVFIGRGFCVVTVGAADPKGAAAASVDAGEAGPCFTLLLLAGARCCAG
ncbi:MAG TPA: hypothetical protein VGF62_06090, partial [Rhizomicrobium sp.]